MLKKILTKIVDWMVLVGSSELEGTTIQKSNYDSKKLETAMKAPIDKTELKKRILHG